MLLKVFETIEMPKTSHIIDRSGHQILRLETLHERTLDTRETHHLLPVRSTSFNIDFCTTPVSILQTSIQPSVPSHLSTVRDAAVPARKNAMVSF